MRMKRLPAFLSVLLLILGSVLFSRAPDLGRDLPLFSTGFVLAAAGYLGLLKWGLPVSARGWVPVFVLLVLVPRLLAFHLNPSDDLAHCIWQGRILGEGYNPFSAAPDDPRLAAFRAETDPRVNSGDTPGVHPPLAPLVFPAETRARAGLTRVLKNSFAFGGSNAVILLGRGDAA